MALFSIISDSKRVSMMSFDTSSSHWLDCSINMSLFHWILIMASPWNTQWTSKELFLFLLLNRVADVRILEIRSWISMLMTLRWHWMCVWVRSSPVVNCILEVWDVLVISRTTKATEDEEIIFQHQVGTACLHLGKHRHQALPISSGRRLNLILWVKQQSELFGIRRLSFFLSSVSSISVRRTKTVINVPAGVECIEYSMPRLSEFSSFFFLGNKKLIYFTSASHGVKQTSLSLLIHIIRGEASLWRSSRRILQINCWPRRTKLEWIAWDCPHALIHA